MRWQRPTIPGSAARCMPHLRSAPHPSDRSRWATCDAATADPCRTWRCTPSRRPILTARTHFPARQSGDGRTRCLRMRGYRRARDRHLRTERAAQPPTGCATACRSRTQHHRRPRRSSPTRCSSRARKAACCMAELHHNMSAHSNTRRRRERPASRWCACGCGSHHRTRHRTCPSHPTRRARSAQGMLHERTGRFLRGQGTLHRPPKPPV